ncbi:MAG: PBP1A family penicillin-binding protein [Clostridia bacterium]|nr:PBP1A family penicillin-binding protein [Clostridia bacterium]
MKNNPYTRVFIKFFSVTIGIGLIALAIIFACTVLGFFGGISDLDINSLTMDSSSQVFYIDAEGNQKPLTTLSSEQNRIWVDFKDIPQDLKDAIVSIEDERFYTHKGFDIKRTARAFFEFVKNKITRKPTTFGGSTITQQLVKNITQQRDRTAARKILEISRAVNLEKKVSKDKILELYLNSIYLSQGCSGVQSASHKFFGKPVSELNLAECASIAGITQYPSLYDPLVNPENNKEKQEVVLSKMLELGYINQEEHDEAVAFELSFTEFDPEELTTGVINSYFIDHLIQEIIDGLVEKGYSETLASKMIYSGGLKITATIDPNVQRAIEDVFEDTANFPNATGSNPAQASMAVMDPYTGEIKGLVGGIGKKSGNLVLNRATQTLRQPGSTIKPIAVYAPAFEYGLINPADIYQDKAISYGGWTPRNYDHKYNDDVSVRVALRRSLNTIPVQILNEMGADRSFNFLTQKLGITSLVKNETNSEGKVFSDIGLSQLALGGLTHGVSVIELTAAYAPFVNRGIYTEPHCFTSVVDAEGNEILSADIKSNIAMDDTTAFVTSMLLKEVVTSGTGGGAQLPSGMFTAGKTGTTSDNHDRWFVGYTPHYVAAAWYGYDSPQPIPASGNPCIPVWRSVMSKINAGKKLSVPPAPAGVKYVTYCTKTGNLPGEHCGEEVSSCWFIADNVPKEICTSLHKTEEELKAEEEAKKQEENKPVDEITVPEEGAAAPDNQNPEASDPNQAQAAE